MNKLEITKLVEEIRIHASELYNTEIPKLKIRFDLKGLTAGKCGYNSFYDFNLYIAQNNKDFRQTVYHEVAHQVAVQVYGERGYGHGRYWKSVMRGLGVAPKTTHNYKVLKPARQVKRYKYICECGEVMIVSAIRYNRSLKNGTIYRHADCGAAINMKLAKLEV